jgi:ATP-binding cassette subfamily C protein
VATGDPLVRACQLVAAAAHIELPAATAAAGATPGERMTAVARSAGFRIRRVSLAGAWWRQDVGPLVGFRAPGMAPVALLPRGPGRYVLVDPQDGRRTAVAGPVAAALAEEAYALYRGFPERALTAWDVIRFGLVGTRRDLWTVAWMGVLGGLLGLLVPIATGLVFDTLIPGADRPRLLQMTMGLIVAAMAAGVFEVTRSVALLRLSGRVDASVQAATWGRLLDLPVPFFRGFTAGDLATRSNAINAIQQTLTGVVLSAVLSAVFSLFSFALLFYYSVRLALLCLGMVLLLALVTAVANSVQLRRQRALLRVQGTIAGLVLQLIQGVAKLRVAGAEARAFSVWARDFAEQRRLAFRGRAIANALTVFDALWSVGAGLVLFWAMAFWLEPPLDTATFLSFNAAFGQFCGALLGMTAAATSSLGVIPLYERARPILQTPPEVERARMDPGRLRGDIELSHVSFRYQADGPLALHDVSLAVRAGEFLALVGPSGSGKTTLCRLLLGFDRPEAGSVFYNGQDLGTLDLRAVRRQIGTVLQNGRVMPGTIFQNIVGAAPLSEEDAWEAARATGLDEDIKAMPMGMHTFISEGAATISGGQRQRLLIARAIVTRPRILLFDEATSALDNQTQAIVSQSLAGLNATRIVIAHRLSTIMKADRILVLQTGRLVESGRYDELMAANGVFAALARRQLV